MKLFNQTMRVCQEMKCECCDAVLPIWKLQRPKMRKITKKMEKLLLDLGQYYKDNPKLRRHDKAFIIKRDDPGFYQKTEEEQMEDLVNSLSYYSDRWCYSRYTRAKQMWTQYKKIQGKYQKIWDKNDKVKRKNSSI